MPENRRETTAILSQGEDKTSQKEAKIYRIGIIGSIILILGGLITTLIPLLFDVGESAQNVYGLISVSLTILGGTGIVATTLLYTKSLILLGYRIQKLWNHIDTQIKKLESLEAANNQLKNEIESTNTKLGIKLDCIGIWSKTDIPEKIPVNVTNMDEYVIHIPFHLASKAFLAERIEIIPKSQGSDEEAIKHILTNGGGIAIADPFVIQRNEFVGKDLLILSPIVIKYPILHLDNNISGKERKILSYDKKGETSAAARVLSSECNDIDNDNILTIKDISRELMDAIRKHIDTNKNDEYNSEDVQFLHKMEKYRSTDSDNKFHYSTFIFELSIFSSSFIHEPKYNDLKTFLISEFDSFSDFYLMEPELTYIKDIILQISKVPQQIKDSEKVFTCVITTKKYVSENPLLTLKFLKALRIGILKCHTLFSAGNIFLELKEVFNNDNIPHNDSISPLLEKIENKSHNFNKDLYPTDLILYNSSIEEDIKKIGFNTARQFVLNWKKDIEQEDGIFHFIAKSLQL
jgi:hypothetical protein